MEKQIHHAIRYDGPVDGGHKYHYMAYTLSDHGEAIPVKGSEFDIISPVKQQVPTTWVDPDPKLQTTTTDIACSGCHGPAIHVEVHFPDSSDYDYGYDFCEVCDD